MSDGPRLIVHVVYRFAVGGLENGLINLINRLPASTWRHAVLSLTDIDRGFARRLARDDVEMVALGKGHGHALPLYPVLYRHFRRWSPAIVHTRNLAALEAVVPAWAARVPVRIHGEHGRDAFDPDGRSRRRQWIRRIYRPFVSRYVTVSPDLERYLVRDVGIDAQRIDQIFNGVDTARFSSTQVRRRVPDCPFTDPRHWIVGTVGRLDAVKDQTLLARAFVEAVARDSTARERMRLVIVGEGALRREIQSILAAAGAGDLAWLPGERSDVPELLRTLDAFVLPSRAEGVSNTLLEAMATGLPCIATGVGANRELIESGAGTIVPPSNCTALADALLCYLTEPAIALAHANAARQRAVRHFSLDSMVDRYQTLYSHCVDSASKSMSAGAAHPAR